MTERITITNRNGALSVRGRMEPAAMNAAARQLRRGEVEPPFGYKLRRFCRRLGRAAQAKWDEWLVGYQDAEPEGFISRDLPPRCHIDIPLR